MKRNLVFSIMAALVVYGCQIEELNDNVLETTPEEISEAKVFTATIEDNASGETKTTLDAGGNVLWKQGDQVSIFAGDTVNEQYQVTDASDGKTSAAFNKVSGGGFVGGGEIDNNVAFYPYASTAEIAKSGSSYVISDIALPATQTYAENSFGNGAFPMAAVTTSTTDMHLKFKNVLGGLKLQLKGTASIASISITGNQNEILCGAASVTVSNGSAPSINLTDASAKTVTLDCVEGVQLNAETATPFVIALPPMTMEGGFTVVVTDTYGRTMEIKTTKTQTINRSNLLKMPAVIYEGEETDYVDLGLSVNWARVNLGATTPDEYGCYYQWAGTTDVSNTNVSKSNCPFYNGSTWDKYASKYQERFLEPMDDAAHVILGDNWRIPTSDEWAELMQFCTWTWYQLNGMYGYKIQSNIIGYSDNWIFIPAAGRRSGSSFSNVGETCYYWTSMLYGASPDYAGIMSYKPGNSLSPNKIAYRYYGLSIRPVSSAGRQNTIINSPNKVQINIAEQYGLGLSCSANSGATLQYTSLNPDIATIDQSGLVSGVSAGVATIIIEASSTSSYKYASKTVLVTVSSSTFPSDDYIDLGLSVKWARCNLGAASPEEYGGLYQWAGITNVKNTTESLSMPYKTLHLTKYNTQEYDGIVDNKTTLDACDDPAAVTMGGSWRMPTEAEAEELINNCTFFQTTINSIKGIKLTSKKPGYTDKWIFLPAAGTQSSTGSPSFVGDFIIYWTSGLYVSDCSRGVVLELDSGTFKKMWWWREYGLPIRPVRE